MTFTIVFKGQFPLDMLRHDRCWPDTPADATLIEDSFLDGIKYREVNLRTDQRSINIDRWVSFMCKVVC